MSEHDQPSAEGPAPDPTVVHPSIGPICCHELPTAGADIPRHISILPSQWPARQYSHARA